MCTDVTNLINITLNKTDPLDANVSILLHIYNLFHTKIIQLNSTNLKNINSFDFLANQPLISYQLSTPCEDIKSKLLNSNNEIMNDLIKYDQNNKKANAVICFENRKESICYIIEYSDVSKLTKLLKNNNSCILDVTTKIKNQKKFFIEKYYEEIMSFRRNFEYLFNKNPLISYTFNPIITFIIQKQLLPSYIFHNQNFLDYDENDDDNITLQMKHNMLIFLLETNYQAEEKLKQVIADLFEYFEKGNKSTQKKKIKKYEIDDLFIVKSYGTERGSFKTVINTKSFQFLHLRDFTDRYDFPTNNDRNEFKFCRKDYNRFFVPFKGYIEKNGKIKGLIYKYMSNGDLLSYINAKREKGENINPIPLFLIICQIVLAIKYLHSKSIVDVDLHAKNFLLDKNLNSYLSNYENFANVNDINLELDQYHHEHDELYEGNQVSYADNIISLVKIINFVFKGNDKDKNTLLDDNILKPCFERSKHKIDEIQQSLIEKVTSFSFFREEFIAELKPSEIIESLCKTILLIREYQVPEKDNFDKYYIKEINMFAEILCLYKYKAQKYISPYFNTIAENYLYLHDPPESQKAIKYFSLLLKINDSNAQFNLGNMYDQGYGVKRDPIKAEKYYLLSISQNNAQAFLNFGLILLTGNEATKKNIKKGVKFLYEAEKTLPRASFILGLIYKNGNEEVQIDYSIAITQFEKASRNEPEALFQLGILDENNQQKYFQRYADEFEGEQKATAYFKIGHLFCNGFEVKQNFEEAKKWYWKGIKLNAYSGYYFLGIIYSYGHDESSFQKALEYYNIAGKNNVPLSYLRASFLFRSEAYGHLDYKEAIRYLQLEADRNEITAFVHLGYFYQEGYGSEKNHKKAVEYYKKAAELGSSDALMMLGDFYLNYTNDIKSAIKYYSEAGNEENINALTKLVILYLDLNNGRSSKESSEYTRKIIHILIKNDFMRECFIGRFINTNYFDKALDFFKNIKNMYSLLEDNNLEKAQKLLNYLRSNDYSYSRNLLTLFYEFIGEINRENEKAKFKSEVNNNLKFLEIILYNMANLLEEEGNFNKAINLMIKISECEEEQLSHKTEISADKPNISLSIFIFCLVNLSLTYFNLQNKNYQEAKKFFRRSFSEINFQNNFEFYLNEDTNYSYIWNFILNSPLFIPFDQSNLIKIDHKILKNAEIPNRSIHKESSPILINQPEIVIDYIIKKEYQREKFTEELNQVVCSMKTTLS